ncbi:MAG TPA: EAL domain-containing protein [Halomonas sp.]|nr:EAL domain-containing protein [Halomonas sp.]
MDDTRSRTTLPFVEQARLEELHALQILDTQPEERFDRFTRLVSQIFDVPTALVSLVDRDRQWFKSAVGQVESETPHDVSFCLHALEHDFLEIPDALEDVFFRTHKAVVGSPFVRFYAGVVLRGPTGQPLGTLCISDTHPRYLSSMERSWLMTFGKLVQEQINQHAELSHARDQLKTITQRDARTGLPGETLFGDTLHHLIRLADNEAYYLAVLHLRLNNLDEISRSHGRGARDAVLQILAERLTAPDIKILAAGHTSPTRFGAVVSLYNIRDLFSVITPIVNRLNAPIGVEGHSVRPDIDVGISVSPDDGAKAEDLLERARAALKGPKSHEGIHVFTRHTEASAVRRHWIEQRLEPALQAGQLVQYYQPLFDADGIRIVGFEALARWQDAELGSVSPGEFVPIAETSVRLSQMLTDWSLRSVCEKGQTWPLKDGDAPLRMAINIPANQFFQPRFVDHILETLSRHWIKPDRLTLELTEESLLTDFDQAIKTMRRLQDHNIALALDDFGTGYSSLSYLKRLPVDTLKIDKSFIDDLPHDTKALNLVRGIVGIAHGLDVSVVAEGVEHESQRALLKEVGCDELQGYLFSRPLEAEAALNMLGIAN